MITIRKIYILKEILKIKTKEVKQKMDELDITNIEDEQMLDEIRGETTRKPKISLLNQKKVSKWELDELFTDEEEYEEEF
ncbi:hypothetical protein K9L97_05195 [Candidatus Woesearchaeota archaeon]|nr:hypothetical protein [Candidatus Woesearchaeota archaeon]